MLETRAQSLGQEDPLEKEMATHSSILAWRIPWTEEPGGLQSMGLQRDRHGWETNRLTGGLAPGYLSKFKACTSIPKKKKCKKANWLYKEALQIAEKIRGMKSKGEKKTWMQSSTEYQGEIRKPSSVISAKIDENNRMGKTRDLYKNISDTKGPFHAKMDTIKDRNGINLSEAEDIKKRWQQYTELYKKDLHDPENYNGVFIHLESDILKNEVKWL